MSSFAEIDLGDLANLIVSGLKPASVTGDFLSLGGKKVNANTVDGIFFFDNVGTIYLVGVEQRSIEGYTAGNVAVEVRDHAEGEPYSLDALREIEPGYLHLGDITRSMGTKARPKAVLHFGLRRVNGNPDDERAVTFTVGSYVTPGGNETQAPVDVFKAYREVTKTAD